MYFYEMKLLLEEKNIFIENNIGTCATAIFTIVNKMVLFADKQFLFKLWREITLREK